jgi:hypothetical protein
LEAPVLHSPFAPAEPLALAAVAVKIVGNCLGLAGFVAVVFVLAFLAEPGPQLSSFSATHVAFATPAGDPIGALIRQDSQRGAR